MLDSEAAEEIRKANLSFQKQQIEQQQATNEVLLKVGKAAGEHRQRIKTEVSPIGASNAVTLFFELVEFARQMTELQIGAAD